MKILITGASSGMGFSMASYLASLGHDLYVVARDKKKLDNKYKGFKTKVVALGFDLSISDNCYKLYNKVKRDNIDILINNAGFGDSGNFSETSLNKELNMIDVNVRAYHILTKLFLRDFIKRNYGRILNVASMAGFMPGPYMSCYYATKAYILNLSLGIAEELRRDGSNVKISIFCPRPVETNFEKVAKVKFNILKISSDYAARYAIDNMFQNKLLIIPPNMKLNHMLVKIAPIKVTMLVNSNVQERNSRWDLQ